MLQTGIGEQQQHVVVDVLRRNYERLLGIGGGGGSGRLKLSSLLLLLLLLSLSLCLSGQYN